MTNSLFPIVRTAAPFLSFFRLTAALDDLYKMLYNNRVKRPEMLPPEMPSEQDPLSRYGGPAETIAASLPKELAEAIRAQAGKRGFSRFVGRALARELLDQNRAAYVAGMEMIHGPVDGELVAQLEKVLGR